MSQKQNTIRLRKGQQDLAEYLPSIKAGDCISIQWPTGYGKSVGFAMGWAHCVQAGIANRFLLVVANDTQRTQIINDFAGDCKAVNAPCRGGVWSFDRSGGDILAAINATAVVFVTTVQQLCASNRGGLNTLKDLLTASGTKWMLGFDEFHHYGKNMAWGDAAESAMELSAFSLAMSATPYSRASDLIFPESTQVVTYAEAVEEKCVKPMICHSYDYHVTVVDGSGEREYTTSELLEVAIDGIDEWEERRNIRYSPDYIHPLITKPLLRLGQKKLESGVRLQMLVRAMSCSHAEMVCKQIRAFTGGGLSVDWIGTGPRGRSQDTNARLREEFCPPKVNGKRPAPSLDVLVQVSMAAEGFDSINVAEIVDFFPVSKRAKNGLAVSDKQFYGRGSRVISDAPDVRLHVSVPSDHPLHEWAGMELHRWMDSSGTEVTPRVSDKTPEPPEFDPFDVPEFPRRRTIELLNVTTEDELFKSFGKAASAKRGWNFDDDKEELFEIYRQCVSGLAERENEQAYLVQAKDSLNTLVNRIVYILAKQDGSEVVFRAAFAKHAKMVNGKIKDHFGDRDSMMLPEVERAYAWCQNYIAALKAEQR